MNHILLQFKKSWPQQTGPSGFYSELLLNNYCCSEVVNSNVQAFWILLPWNESGGNCIYTVGTLPKGSNLCTGGKGVRVNCAFYGCNLSHMDDAIVEPVEQRLWPSNARLTIKCTIDCISNIKIRSTYCYSNVILPKMRTFLTKWDWLLVFILVTSHEVKTYWRHHVSCDGQSAKWWPSSQQIKTNVI